MRLLALFFSFFSALGADNGGWQEVLRDNDIVVFRKKIEGSHVLAYRGEAVVSAPIAKVMTVIIDPNQRAKWTARVKEFKILEEHSPCERTEYMHVNSPFPAKDRDFVVRSKMTFSRQNNKLVVQLRSVEDPRRQVTRANIRGTIHSSSFSLQPINENTTKIEAEIHADPKGGIPKWLVNRFQKYVPQKSLANLKHYLANNQIAADPMATAFFTKRAGRSTAADKTLHCIGN